MADDGVRLVAQGDRDVPDGDEWLTGDERAELAGFSYEKRRHDWRLRRWTAKRALGLVVVAGTAPSRLTVEHTDDGAPRGRADGEPIDCTLSVSDSHGWALAAVGLAASRLGCDVEHAESRSDAFVQTFLDDAEQRIVAGGVDANLVWSAKEAALKALGVGLDRPVRSVHVSLVEGELRGGWSRLRVVSDEDAIAFDGWWRHHEGFVLTVVGDALDAPPTFVVFSGPG